VALPRRGGRARYRLALLVLTAVTLLTLDFRGFGPLETAQTSLRDVLAPMRSAVMTVVRPVGDAAHGIFDYGHLEHENAQLRARVEDLMGKQLQGEVDSQTLRQLQQQLSIPYIGDVQRVVARLTAGPTGNFDQSTIEIDKGSSSGIKAHMAVVTSAGLVGKVTRVDGTRSVVQLLSAPEFAVGVRIGDEVTLARGTGAGNPLRASAGLSSDNKVAVGDPVLTSGGTSSWFPPGVPVGRIADVDTSAGTPVVTIAPAADVANVDFVSVLLFEATAR
jgi:rod shape-determining protein MreC